jgi:hypothetical protein
MTEEIPQAPEPFIHALRNTTNYKKTVLTIACVICFAIFWFTGRAMHVPLYYGHAMSLLMQPRWPVLLIVVAILTIVSVLIGTLIAGRIRADAGIFAAAAGLSALSMRGGPMRDIIIVARDPGIFYTLASELVFLYAILGAGWAMLQVMQTRSLLRRDVHREELADMQQIATAGPLSLATQVIVMCIMMILLCQSDQKGQVLAAVGLSSYLATLAAHNSFPTLEAFWYWSGPLIVGVIGYILARQTPASSWTLGQVGSMFPGTAALARPLPLDYAAAGPIGALIAYWTSMKWLVAKESGDEEES